MPILCAAMYLLMGHGTALAFRWLGGVSALAPLDAALAFGGFLAACRTVLDLDDIRRRKG